MKEIEVNREYTYKDIKDEEGRWEVIDGIPFLLASPSYKHQSIVGKLYLEFSNHMENEKCTVILSPFDVQFDTEEEGDHSKKTVQPDLMVVCDENKITSNKVKGSPDLIIEVLSPGTALKDRNQKYRLYEEYSVKEYWLVDPSNKTIEVLGLENEKYTQRKVFGPEDTLESILFTNLQFKLNGILS